MMGAVRGWLSAVVAVSILLGAVQSLLPEGTVRRVASLTGGLVMIVVLLQPLTKLSVGALRLDMDAYAGEVARRQEELEREQEIALSEGIAERTGAYIEDKAAALGLSCTAKVTVRTGEDGVPVPWSAELSCAPSAELAACVDKELGIPKERQVFHGT